VRLADLEAGDRAQRVLELSAGGLDQGVVAVV
jgi:hypothetical protein